MTIRTVALSVACLAWPLMVQAQTASVDERWAPYMGCWQLDRESGNAGIVNLAAAAAREASPDQRRDDVMVCVTPVAQPNAVAQQTVLNGDTVLDEVVAADGKEQTAEMASCTSTRRAEWSASGRQMFSRGTLTCKDQPDRRIAGLSMVLPGPTWVDVQMSEVRGQRSVRVRRYVRAPEQRRADRASARGTAPQVMERWTLDEVKDAARHTEPEVLEAAVVEAGTKLPLNSRRLIELDDAGVPGRVVDVLMAMSFPERFVLERPDGGSTGGFGGMGGGGGSPWVGLVDPFMVASRWGWVSMYAPFGYQYYGMYDPRFGPGWGWVVVNPPGGSTTPPDDAAGRVMNNQGYTRVSPRLPDPVIRTSGGSTNGGGRGGDNTSGGSGGGTATGGGYSSGGGGGSSSGSSGGGGRTAVPRPPGGGAR